MKRTNHAWRLFAGAGALLGAATLATAGTFQTDFNAGIPVGVNLFGTSAVYDHSTGGVANSGVLKITDNTGSQQGGAIIDDFDGGATIGGFEATFDLYIGSGNGADGLSFFFGDFSDAAHPEEGPGSIEGLTITFDSFNNGGAIAEAPAIDLKWNNTILVHRLVGAASTTTGAAPIGTATTIRTQPTTGGAAVFWPVKITVDTDGTVDLVYNNVVIFTNVPAFKPVTEFSRGSSGTARFGFGGRTGGSTDNHFVDNLKITTKPLDAGSGQPYLVSAQPINLLSPTAGINPTQINPVVITLQDQTFTVNPTSVVLRYNNTIVTPIVTQENGQTRIAYSGVNGLLPTGAATVDLTYTTTSTPPVTTRFSYTFNVNAATVLPGGYNLASVDTTKPGFKGKLHQMNINRNPATGQPANAERQIANGYIDPFTGLPYENTADLSLADADGYFIDEDVINWNEVEGGSVGSFPNDEPVPSITGGFSVNGTDRYVWSLETILELKAGGIRFGVNTDDGFRLSIGHGPGDVAGTQLGTAGDRGPTDSYLDVVIPVDGFYPVRLMWWETGGGSAAEFFTVNVLTGKKTLINDPNDPDAIKAYRESAETKPYVSRTLPAVNYNWAHADQDLVIDVTDGASPMDAGSAVLTINGVAQAITASKSGKVTTLKRASSMDNLLPSMANNVRLVYSHTKGSATFMVTNNWVFNVPRYTRPIPPGNRVAASSVSGNGFRVNRVHQLDRSADANQGNGGRYTGNGGGGNNMPRPEIQLGNGYINPSNNQPYPNRAANGGVLTGAEVFDVFNFNWLATGTANIGIFNGDTNPGLGLPGTGTSNAGLDNYVMEVFTYLDLKKGVHIFGFNVDDGYTVTSSPNPRDTLGTIVGYREGPGGQNGNPINFPNGAFTVLVAEDGVYPFRILFWQGGGGVNGEMLTVDRDTGTQLMLNDVGGIYPSVVGNSGASFSPIAAFSDYAGPVRPWVKFSVYPMPNFSTLWQNQHQQSGPGPINVRVGAGNPADIANDAPGIRPFGDAVGAVVADLGSGSVGMVIDGQAVTPTVSNLAGGDKLVMHWPNPPFASGSTHTAGLVYAGTTNYWTFTVINHVELAAGTAQPLDAKDDTARGFRARIFQASAGQANTAARAESQISGGIANVAIAGPEADGAYAVPGVINWNVTKAPGGTPADNGNFTAALTGTPDAAVPGIPGTGLTGALRFENITAEIFAWLELPAGYQKFAVNGDDGWKVQIGTPGKTDGPVLFTVDRGAGARDIPFAFIAPEAGLYPVRLVWYQGGGGGNVEFFSYGPDNSKILVNDASNPLAVKAYQKLKETAPLQLSVALEGANVVLSWTGGGTLEETAEVGAGAVWTTSASQANPQTLAPAGTKFYRLRR